mgnify:CR=1 FL=1
MREIQFDHFDNTVADLLIRANKVLPSDLRDCICAGECAET